MAMVTAKSGSTALPVDQQLDSIKQVNSGTLDMRGTAASHPSLSHHKQNILGIASRFPKRLHFTGNARA